MSTKLIFLVIILLSLLISILFSLNIGATHINLWALVSSQAHQALNREVVLFIRAPRVAMGVLAGAALGERVPSCKGCSVTLWQTQV